MYKAISFLLLLIALSMGSCSPPPKPPITKQMRKVIDSLYAKSADSLKKEIDLICEKNFKRTYQHAIDSIQSLRREEIESILDQ